MTLATMLALAANEPWCLAPDRAAKLSLYQLARVVLGPDRDPDGRVDTADPNEPLVEFPSERELFDLWAEANRVPRWRAEQLRRK